MANPEGGGRAEARQYMRGSVSENPFGRAGVKEFDSPTVREWEPFSAALSDLRFAIACCDELLENPQAAFGANPTLQRALWDALLVAVFKQYGKGAHPSVRAVYEAVLAEHEPVREAFDEWEHERNRRVAHSVGFRESQHIIVALPSSPGGSLWVTGVPFTSLRPEDAGVALVRQVLTAIADRLSDEAERFMPAIVEEVNALSDAEVLALPDLDPPLFGRGRPPGSKRVAK